MANQRTRRSEPPLRGYRAWMDLVQAMTQGFADAAGQPLSWTLMISTDENLE